MTQEEREFLKSQIDEVVLLTTTDGKHMLAQILIVFDEGDTPDLFCLEVEPTQSGYVQKGTTGHSILLSDIASVRRPRETGESS